MCLLEYQEAQLETAFTQLLLFLVVLQNLYSDIIAITYLISALGLTR